VFDGQTDEFNFHFFRWNQLFFDGFLGTVWILLVGEVVFFVCLMMLAIILYFSYQLEPECHKAKFIAAV